MRNILENTYPEQNNAGIPVQLQLKSAASADRSVQFLCGGSTTEWLRFSSMSNESLGLTIFRNHWSKILNEDPVRRAFASGSWEVKKKKNEPSRELLDVYTPRDIIVDGFAFEI